MKSLKNQELEMENYLKLLSESNSQRIDRIEEKMEKITRIEAKMETIGTLVVNMEKCCIENRRKISELEASSHQLQRERQIVQQNRTKVSSKRGKLYRIKARVHSFVSTVSIPGISRIVGSEVLHLRLFWILLILASYSFGLYNIAQSIKDYYKSDVITNVETATPDNFTLPAITICAEDYFVKTEHFSNGTLATIEKHKSPNISIKDFISSIAFIRNYQIEYFFDISVLEFFKIPTLDIRSSYLNHGDCFRLNGATNKQMETIIFNRTSDLLAIRLTNQLDTSEDSNTSYSLSPYLYIYIGDNYLNSFSNAIPALISPSGTFCDFHIEKTTIEEKLAEPHNQCRKSSEDLPYLRMNCIESCLFSKVGIKYKCTFNNSLFTISGLRECESGFSCFMEEFYNSCKEECPIGCDSTKFVTTYSEEPLLISSQLFTQLIFSVSDFSSLKITQIPKLNEFNFISNIGGSLGLFMGISFLNSIELFKFFIDIFSITFFES